MQRTTIDFGIDLGTTNSVISVAQAGAIETVKNGLSEITPSLVGFDKRGAKRVGLAAAEFFNRPSSASEVHAEFKRVMGQRVLREFKASGKSMSPEELSAEVLIELRRACAARFGEEPEAAVITVPAMFEAPQNEATAEAARLAGFSHSQLLQEPVAAAVAYGFQTDAERAYWLVYDYGGGTFDASIVAIRDGQLTVVKHAGDNYLGGADLDWMIVEELMIPDLQLRYSLDALGRAPSARALDRARMLVLKRHAENIKKRLSTEEAVEYFEENIFEDDDGVGVDIECKITREDFEQLAEPAVSRSITIVDKLIQDSGIPKAKLDRFLLVGGSTFIPYVRQRTAALGIPIGLELDPMTVVSRGAAIFASAQRLPSSRSKPVSASAGTAVLQLEYESVVKELEPLVGGRVEVDGRVPLAGTTISLRRDDNGWNSGDISVDQKGMFFSSVKIRERGQSSFEITARTSDGKQFPCSPSSLAITYGLQIASAPLPAGVGIALADGRALILHKAGSLLPRPEEVYKAQVIKPLRRGSTDSLRIPVISGDEPLAEHNRCGTFITIRGTDLSRDVPAGSEVEIRIAVDASGVPHVRAYVPLLDETFEPAERSQLEHEPAEVMRDRKVGLITRLEKVEEKADDNSMDDISSEALNLRLSDEMDQIDTLIEQWEAGDNVAAGQARNLLVDMAKRVQALEAKVELPATIAEYNSHLDDARKAAAEYGDASDRKNIEEIAREGSKALQTKDAKMLQHCNEQLRSIEMRLITKNPAFWVGFLRHLSTVQHQFSDQAMGRRLLNEGAQAVQRGDVDSVRSVVQQLMRLLPRETAAKIGGAMGSDVM
jgi:molecular chaperone DnaK